MVAEVLEHLEPSRGGLFIDCTVGLGGHARALRLSPARRREIARKAARARWRKQKA